LVTNAIDACINIDITQRQGRVLLRTLKTEGWAVEFQVVDNGCGMDEETKEKIFRRFFSTKGSRGTGLGLMITKKIIDEHEGAIEFASEKGKGTRFVIRLPEKDQSTSI
ncbi:MAG: ATP-binding protein, partial [Gammaproteobacteria bacterium]|nr:ATP-binding protein [Gammaproteobacteria bacterium]